MKTHTPPQPLAIRVTGISLLIAILTAGGVINAQQPLAETPTAAVPAAHDPAPGPRSNGRIPAPEKETPPKARPVDPNDPAPSRIVETLTDPRTKSIIRKETDANGNARTPQCDIDLRIAGQMSDIVSNVLLRAEHKPESEVQAFLKDAHRNYATGDDLLKAAAEHFKIDQKRLAALVEHWRHINCKHAAIPGYHVSDAAREATIVRTILDEEVSSNPQEAARNYEAAIAAFDSQREYAAQAIFRLGEIYRKLGRLEEARIQYARILREFVDFPDLARLSQKQLSQNPPAVVQGGDMTGEGSSVAGIVARAAAASAEERNLLLQEIGLLENQLEETHQLVKNGVAGTDTLIPIQREILQLKRQLLRHENSKDPVPARNAVAPSVKEAPATKP